MSSSTEKRPFATASGGTTTVIPQCESGDRATEASHSKIRIAVATKGYGLINQHFGHAKEFLIYEVDGNAAQLIAQRPVSQYCHGKDNGPGDLSEITQILGDCEAVLVAKIGAVPADRLREAGIEAVEVYDTIETALWNYYEEWCSTPSDDDLTPTS